VTKPAPGDRMIGASLGPGMEFFMRASALGVFIMGSADAPFLPNEAIRHQLTLRADIMFEMDTQGRA